MSDSEGTIFEEIKNDPEARVHYAEMLLDCMIALQIKTIRQQRVLTQRELAELAGMKQQRICAMEKIDYSSWSVKTLKRLANALGVRLRVTFEGFGSLVDDYNKLDRVSLERPEFKNDPAFNALPAATTAHGKVLHFYLRDSDRSYEAPPESNVLSKEALAR